MFIFSAMRAGEINLGEIPLSDHTEELSGMNPAGMVAFSWGFDIILFLWGWLFIFPAVDGERAGLTHSQL